MMNVTVMDKELIELNDFYKRAMDLAHEWHLEPFETDFHVVPSHKIYEVASYGIPGHFSHWSYGKEYWKAKSAYDKGHARIYELVINANPAQAFLLDTNSTLDNMFVIAHVIGHVDFFANNAYFAHTNRNILAEAASSAERFRQYEIKYGRDVVEDFISDVLAIHEHIDPHLLSKATPDNYTIGVVTDPYADLHPEETALKDRELELQQAYREQVFPPEPVKDLLQFIASYNHKLKPWQVDVIMAIRSETLYFLPQYQSKIMNEGWACKPGHSRLNTTEGLLRIDEVVENKIPVDIFDGQYIQRVTDWFKFESKKTIKLTTNIGLEIEGSDNHRILINGSWKRLDEFAIDDEISLNINNDIWQNKYVMVNWLPELPQNYGTLCEELNISRTTLMRAVKNGPVSEKTKTRILNGLKTLQRNNVLCSRTTITVPEIIDEDFAQFLGMLVGDGNLTLKKSGIINSVCFTNEEPQLIELFVRLAKRLFNVSPHTVFDPTDNGNNRWRVHIYSADLGDFLVSLGIKTGKSARIKEIPEVIYRSPKSVVAAFIRGLFDTDGYAGDCGVILSSSAPEIYKNVQLLLLNFGIISNQIGQNYDICNLIITGNNALVFQQEIGFALARKRFALAQYLDNRNFQQSNHSSGCAVPNCDKAYRARGLCDMHYPAAKGKNKQLRDMALKYIDTYIPTIFVKEISTGTQTVYDITVENTHQYSSEGVINHNSISHNKFMHILDPDIDPGGIDFADIHSGVLSPSFGSLNPYWLGYNMYKHIIQAEDKKLDDTTWMGEPNSDGWQKVLEIRSMERDESFIRNYLDKALCEQLNLFTFEFDDSDHTWWVTQKQKWEAVRDDLVQQRANMGFPYITVVDADYTGGGWLLLKHKYDGRPLDQKWAAKTIQAVYRLWGKGVVMQSSGPDGPVQYECKDGKTLFHDTQGAVKLYD